MDWEKVIAELKALAKIHAVQSDKFKHNRTKAGAVYATANGAASMTLVSLAVALEKGLQK